MHSLAALLLGGAVLTGATPISSGPGPTSTPSFLSSIGLEDPAAGTGNITERDIRGSIPNNAMSIEHRFQPALDFDRDGCYYTSAMDGSGNLNPGLNYAQGVPPNCLRATCRDNNRLENNNVYSRTRCNNGWCAIM